MKSTLDRALLRAPWWPMVVGFAMGCGEPLGSDELDQYTQTLSIGPTEVLAEGSVTVALGDNVISSSAADGVTNRVLSRTSSYTSGKHNFPAAANGQLYLFGDGVHEIYNITNPTLPDFRARLESNYNPVKQTSDTSCTNAAGNPPEAEAHQSSFARYPGSTDGVSDDLIYAATISGRGIDLWDISGAPGWNDSWNAGNPTTRKPLRSIVVGSTCYGDVDNGIWGLSWESERIYLGATNQGIYMVHFNDQRNLSLSTSSHTVAQIATTTEVGFKPGPVWAMAGRLVTAPAKDAQGHGVSILNTENPDDAVPISTGKMHSASGSGDAPYHANFYGKYVYHTHPIRVYDVTSDTPSLKTTFLPTSGGTEFRTEYLTFGDGDGGDFFAYVGSTRNTMAAPNGITGTVKYKLDMANPASWTWERHMPTWETAHWGDTDDQFALPIGNSVVLCDDEKSGGAPRGGCWISRHQTNADTTGAKVAWWRAEAGKCSPKIFVSLNEQVDIGTIHRDSVSMRRVGTTDKWTGIYTVQGTTMTYEPISNYTGNWGTTALNSTASFELRIEGSVEDLAGNGMSGGGVTLGTFQVKKCQ